MKKLTKVQLEEIREHLIDHRVENAELSDLKRLYYDDMDGYYSGLSEEDLLEEAKAYNVINKKGKLL